MTLSRLFFLSAVAALILLNLEASPVHSATAGAPIVWDVTIQPEDANGQARYSPANITISAGDSILWTSRDSADLHNVDIPSLDYASDEFKNGESFLVTFTIAGTYNYVCDPHPYMKGTVIVSDAARPVSWAYLPAAPVKLAASW